MIKFITLFIFLVLNKKQTFCNNRKQFLQFNEETNMNISLDEIYSEYKKAYSDLYDGKYTKPVEECLCDMGDILLKKRSDIAQDLCKEMEDIISSDREVAAFALALYTIGVKYHITFNV